MQPSTVFVFVEAVFRLMRSFHVFNCRAAVSIFASGENITLKWLVLDFRVFQSQLQALNVIGRPAGVRSL